MFENAPLGEHFLLVRLRRSSLSVGSQGGKRAAIRFHMDARRSAFAHHEGPDSEEKTGTGPKRAVPAFVLSPPGYLSASHNATLSSTIR